MSSYKSLIICSLFFWCSSAYLRTRRVVEDRVLDLSTISKEIEDGEKIKTNDNIEGVRMIMTMPITSTTSQQIRLELFNDL